jgi:HlyD family secretion protein
LRIPELRKRAKVFRWAVIFGGLALAGMGGYVYWLKSRPVGPSYRTAGVVRRSIVRVVEASGRLDTRLRFEVAAPAPGRLASISVRVGDTVKQGTVLARLDDRAAALAVQTASASRTAASWRVAEAKANLQAAQRERAKTEQLVAKGLASEQQVLEAKDREARADAALGAIFAEKGVAETTLATARLAEKFGAIIAPIDGIVLSAPETPGEAVAPEKGPLFVVGKPLDKMRLTVEVNEAEIGEVRAGQHAHFDVQAFTGRQFYARVERVGIDAHASGGVVTYPVELAASNPEGALLPGMSALVRIEVARVADALAVREAALRFEPEGASDAPSRSRVFELKRGARLVAVNVEPGLSDGIFTEVRPVAGQTLRAGAQVAVGMGQPAVTSSANGQPGVSLSGKQQK